jgi:hypothetical protein
MAEAVEHLPSKCEALSSTPGTTKKTPKQNKTKNPWKNNFPSKYTCI